LDAPDGGVDVIVAAAAAAAPQPEQRRVDAYRRAVMGGVTGDPAEHGLVARQGVGDLAEVEGKAPTAQQGHA
jgi:hypothetical protein